MGGNHVLLKHPVKSGVNLLQLMASSITSPISLPFFSGCFERKPSPTAIPFLGLPRSLYSSRQNYCVCH